MELCNEKGKMMTSIIILSYNTLGFTQMTVGSIRRHTEPGSYELIVIDNASTDGSREWLEKQADIRLIANEENAGFPKGCNQGLAVARGDNLLLLNSDVFVTPGWLEGLRAGLYRADDIGAVSCVTNHASKLQGIPAPYRDDEELVRFAARINHGRQRYEDRLTVIMFCFLLRREVYEALGPLDERFTPGNYEDDDYCFRIWQAGWRVTLCKDVFIHHFGNASFVPDGEARRRKEEAFEKLLARNKAYFMEKYHVPADYAVHTFREFFPSAECGKTMVGTSEIRAAERAEDEAKKERLEVLLLATDGGEGGNIRRTLRSLRKKSAKTVGVSLLHTHALTAAWSASLREEAVRLGIRLSLYDADVSGLPAIEALASSSEVSSEALSSLTLQKLYFLLSPAILPETLTYVLYLGSGEEVPQDIDAVWDTPRLVTVGGRHPADGGAPTTLERRRRVSAEQRLAPSPLYLNLRYLRERMDLLSDALYFFQKYPEAEGEIPEMLRYYFASSLKVF